MLKVEISWRLLPCFILCFMGGFWIYSLEYYYSGPMLSVLLCLDFICCHFHILAGLESGRSPPRHTYNPDWIYKCHLRERQPQAHETQMKSPLITDLLVHDRNWQVTHQGWKPGKQLAEEGSLSGNTLPPFWSIQRTWRAGTASQTDWTLGILSWKDDNSSRVKEEVEGDTEWSDLTFPLFCRLPALVQWSFREGEELESCTSIVAVLSGCTVPFCQGGDLCLSLCCLRIHIACDRCYFPHTEPWTLLMINLALC